MRRTPRLVSITIAATALVALSASLAGCSAAAPTAAGSSAQTNSGAAPIQIVASINVYGDIAAQIGGSEVSVTSIIDDPDKDPHDYQADAQNQLALSKAQIVIENGGGYDDFVGAMLSSAKNTEATVLNAADISGFDQNPASGEFNEHLWYDMPTVSKVVEQLSTALTAANPASAATFAANAASFQAKLTTIEAAEAAAKTVAAGAGAAITEPVPLYMLTAMGLTNKTPDAFSKAIEDGTDAAPTVLAETLSLFSSHAVAVLAYNSQTPGPQTDAVLNAAKSAGVAVVPVTETLPAGDDFIRWMTANVTAIAAAVAGS
ncbi:metal ABC transporter solute-binding protein, Zn/Mn family [Subtercola lobariae]|uniref:Metal ABC transporter substrate-binding protein n=1 Tax=Subtercola lobariae TaxID=1588641 RepID=A0A917B3P1_9MICO|nr:zinc ABC transporter substrate-binding protein [Subtercola lobariae]GGF19669.1 metal ABC transporter substrate-binding protein [Subtercola lobariae]